MSEIIINSQEKLFGIMPNGEAVFSYELRNKNGFEVKIINYGATITSIKIPMKNDKIIDVVLGFDTLEKYLKSYEFVGSPYFGATVGRYAGRINQGLFSLNNKKYQLNKNHINHSLHGGNIGFSQKIWKVKNVSCEENTSITLSYFSPNNEENFPGDLTVELKYSLSEENELILEYKATTTEDTILNLTNHSYFNLDGHTETVSNQDLFVNSQKILETDTENIPTGWILNARNCPFDFSATRKCPTNIDTSFVLNSEKEVAASLFSEINNLKMFVYTNQPSVHIYVGGNCGSKIKGKENTFYNSLSGICFETQNFPDAPNQIHFPTVVLKTDETYLHKTIYKFEIY
jgi:aldose 1-epimerase